MAVIEFINASNEHYSEMKKVINYIKNPLKTLPHLISGFNCDPDNAYENFVLTKRIFDKEEGRQFIHFTQSFSPDDELTPELAHQIGNDLLNSGMFDGFQVVFSTHLDRDHIHNHFVINTVNFDNGKKWHKSANDLAKLKEHSDELCKSNNLSVIQDEHIKFYSRDYRSAKNGHYKAIREMRSWKHELVLAINECRYVSTSIEDYISRMNQLGYGVEWNYTGESDEVKYAGAVLNICKKHSTSVDEFKENMNQYGYDVHWKYTLEVHPHVNVNMQSYKLIFDDLKSMEDHLAKIDQNDYSFEWKDDLYITNNSGAFFTPNSFEKGSGYTTTALLEAFNINSLNEKKPLPDELKLPKDSLEYKKLVVAIKACKQLSVSKDDFVKKLSELGYTTQWDQEIKEKEIIKAVVKELRNNCTTIDDFNSKLAELGYSLIMEGNSVTVFNTEKGLPKGDFVFKKYDANVILKEFRDNKLNLEQLSNRFEKRYKSPEDMKRQLEIYVKRLDKLVENDYVQLVDDEYIITDKGIKAASNFSGFMFSTYDANVVMGYIERSKGLLSMDNLREFLNADLSDPEYIDAQLKYLEKRLGLNVESGYLAFDGTHFTVTEKGITEKENVVETFRREAKSKKNTDSTPVVKLNLDSLKQSLTIPKTDVKFKTLDEIKSELNKERKHITFETESGIKLRNSSLFPNKQFTKKALEETFLLNKAMKDIINLSNSIEPNDLSRSAKLLGYNLEYLVDKRKFNLEIDKTLKCYFTAKNIEQMKGHGEIKLPSKDEIFKPLFAKKIMYTTPEGMKCTSSELFPFDKYSKEGMLEAFENNKAHLDENSSNARFELLLTAITSLFKSNDSNATRFPFSRLEGLAAKEKALEAAKGRGYNWNKKNDNEYEQ